MSFSPELVSAVARLGQALHVVSAELVDLSERLQRELDPKLFEVVSGCGLRVSSADLALTPAPVSQVSEGESEGGLQAPAVDPVWAKQVRRILGSKGPAAGWSKRWILNELRIGKGPAADAIASTLDALVELGEISATPGPGPKRLTVYRLVERVEGGALQPAGEPEAQAGMSADTPNPVEVALESSAIVYAEKVEPRSRPSRPLKDLSFIKRRIVNAVSRLSLRGSPVTVSYLTRIGMRKAIEAALAELVAEGVLEEFQDQMRGVTVTRYRLAPASTCEGVVSDAGGAGGQLIVCQPDPPGAKDALTLNAAKAATDLGSGLESGRDDTGLSPSRGSLPSPTSPRVGRGLSFGESRVTGEATEESISGGDLAGGASCSAIREPENAGAVGQAPSPAGLSLEQGGAPSARPAGDQAPSKGFPEPYPEERVRMPRTAAEMGVAPNCSEKPDSSPLAPGVLAAVVSRQEFQFEVRRVLALHCPPGLSQEMAGRVLSAIRGGDVEYYRAAHEYRSAFSPEDQEAYDELAMEFMTAGFSDEKPRYAKKDNSTWLKAGGS